MLLLASCARGALPPPATRRDVVVETVHGVEVADPYRWLEEKDTPETRAWIEAQQAYAREVMATAPGQGAVRDRLEELYRASTVTLPVVRGGRTFAARRPADRDLAVLTVRRSPEGPEEVLVDPGELSPEAPVSVQFADVSRDGDLVAYTVRKGGEDEVEIRFARADGAAAPADVLPRGRYFNVSLAANAAGVFYDRQTLAGPRVFHHTLGDDPTADRVVFGRGHGPDEIITSELSANGRYLLINVSHGAAATRNELYFRDAWTGDQVHTIVSEIDATFEAVVAADGLFVLTDWEAPRRRVFAVDLRHPSPDRWTEIVPEGEAVIDGIAAAGERLLVRTLESVQPRIRVLTADGAPIREIEMPGLGGLEADPISGRFIRGDWHSDDAFFAFSSLALPPTIYRYRISTGERSVWEPPAAPVDSDAFTIHQVTYRSADGTPVSMFVAHRADLALDGNRPTLLTGYGGFDVSPLPAFDRSAVVWMEHGGVWALANLRGGGEGGEAWHRAGMLENKQNVFDDFIAAAEWLIAEGYTSPRRLAAAGGSNGGLLVGAALTQRPDLFAAVLCTYPLLDMLRYERFLVARYWVPEYGSADDPEQFEYLRRYSPYHNVRPGLAYPAVMLVSGDGDTRVAPLHARKMTALLQASTGSANPVVLLYDTEAGHSGGRPVSAMIAETAAELRFLLWRLDAGLR